MTQEKNVDRAKHWLVTGASRGIGLELTKQLLQMGERVTAVARNLTAASALQRLKEEFASQLVLIEADVTSDSDIAHVAKALEAAPIDFLINNAGILREAEVSLGELSLELVNEQFAVNVLAPLRVTQALLPLLKKSSRPVVANISSKMGSIADTSSGAYGYRMSKAALNMFSKCLAAELPHGISLSLHPGWVKTEMGGARAPVETRDSATGLLRLIRSCQPSQSGKFFDFRGDPIAW
jgi:NAD(P)-dependent dehydrogenase (short-subunit alcohol dehydrogenase family)